MAAILEILMPDGSVVSSRYENTATIGRAAGNDVVLAESNTKASRQHAVIRRIEPNEYQIVDLGSRNGTFADGQQVILPRRLGDGCRLRFGNQEMVFRLEPELVAPKSDEATIVATETLGAENVIDVAIMVCDIRGFSSHSEGLPSFAVSKLLGEWFRDAGNLIQSKGGLIDKFIGDALLAYWTGRAAAELCATALTVAGEMSGLAARRKWPGGNQSLATGTALHFGPATPGNIGLVAQRDATIIGDTVNTAFRLESLVKELRQTIILSEDFVRQLATPPPLIDHGEHVLKGKIHPVRAFSPSGGEDTA